MTAHVRRLRFPDTLELRRACLLSYHGGKSGLYVPPGVYRDVAEVDIISAYPTAMRALPGVTDGHWRAVREYVPGAAAIYHVVGELRGRCPYGTFMRNAPSTERVHEGAFDVWLTGWELSAAWDELELKTLDGYVWEPDEAADNPFGAYVTAFFERKQAAAKDDPNREIWKLLLNALYGKTMERIEEVDALTGTKRLVAGALFNPFWAAQITGHCRARLHALEHRYTALHASTDSILTQATAIPTGTGLGDLEVKARGTLVVLRQKLYVMLDDTGRVVKAALHGFRGTAAHLLRFVLSDDTVYTVSHMVKPREAKRRGERPFRMVQREYRLHVPADVRRRVAQDLEERFPRVDRLPPPWPRHKHGQSIGAAIDPAISEPFERAGSIVGPRPAAHG
jgi:hypothetical protein